MKIFPKNYFIYEIYSMVNFFQKIFFRSCPWHFISHVTFIVCFFQEQNVIFQNMKFSESIKNIIKVLQGLEHNMSENPWKLNNLKHFSFLQCHEHNLLHPLFNVFERFSYYFFILRHSHIKKKTSNPLLSFLFSWILTELKNGMKKIRECKSKIIS